MSNLIDPITAMSILASLDLNRNCSKNLNIYDGKRRYDMVFDKINITDKKINCIVERVKIGGFKKKEGVLDPPEKFYLTFNEKKRTLEEITATNKNIKLTLTKIK